MTMYKKDKNYILSQNEAVLGLLTEGDIELSEDAEDAYGGLHVHFGYGIIFNRYILREKHPDFTLKEHDKSLKELLKHELIEEI